MSDRYSSVFKQIDKGYNLPHDIERVAHKIYELSLLEKSSTNNNIINKFIDSIHKSKYKNIIGICYNYLNKLSNYDGDLLYEEYLKALHLFDSINILFYFGLNESSLYIEMSDSDICHLIKKYSKWASGIPFEIVDIKNKGWWQRVISKYESSNKTKKRS